MSNVLAKIAGAVVVSALILAAPVAAEPGDDTAGPTTSRLAAVVYDLNDQTGYPTGRLTGLPDGGGAPVTIRPALFSKDAYLMSAGFGDAPPDSVRRWDQAVEFLSQPNDSPTPPPPFAAIGNTQELMKVASKLPANTIVVSYVPDTTNPGKFSLVTLQPVAP
ncbi:MAG: hypothetical protein QOH60_982 [Mycobacterium sp.]|jgi:hypothetical protein|nr:hypothetical protein [Mycobacterium sp.]